MISAEPGWLTTQLLVERWKLVERNSSCILPDLNTERVLCALVFSFVDRWMFC